MHATAKLLISSGLSLQKEHYPLVFTICSTARRYGETWWDEQTAIWLSYSVLEFYVMSGHDLCEFAENSGHWVLNICSLNNQHGSKCVFST
jgi:hypothetical protein